MEPTEKVLVFNSSLSVICAGIHFANVSDVSAATVSLTLDTGPDEQSVRWTNRTANVTFVNFPDAELNGKPLGLVVLIVHFIYSLYYLLSKFQCGNFSHNFTSGNYACFALHPGHHIL